MADGAGEGATEGSDPAPQMVPQKSLTPHRSYLICNFLPVAKLAGPVTMQKVPLYSLNLRFVDSGAAPKF